MKKHTRRNPYTTLVVLAVLLLFLMFTFIQLLGAFFIIHIERATAYESYEARSRSPLGSTQSWEEIEEGIFEKYAHGNWAFQIACGNASTESSLLAFATIFLLFLIIGVNMYITIKKIKLLQKRMKRQQMQRSAIQGNPTQNSAAKKSNKKANSKKHRIVA